MYECLYILGVYVSDENHEDQALFVTERCCFSDLVEGLSSPLSSPCPCGLTVKPWAAKSVVQVSIIIASTLASCHWTVERARVTCVVCLPSLPSTKKDLVKFKSSQWALSSKSEVGFSIKQLYFTLPLVFLL